MNRAYSTSQVIIVGYGEGAALALSLATLAAVDAALAFGAGRRHRSARAGHRRGGRAGSPGREFGVSPAMALPRPLDLRLVDQQPVGAGAVAMRYVPAS